MICPVRLLLGAAENFYLTPRYPSSPERRVYAYCLNISLLLPDNVSNNSSRNRHFICRPHDDRPSPSGAVREFPLERRARSVPGPGAGCVTP